MPLKYRNVPTVVDGIHFDSQKEARRYGELLWLVKAGLIKHLTVHKRFPLEVNGVKVCEYESDFSYLDVETQKYVHEDVKGVRTDLYLLKKKLMRACLNIELVEV